MRSAAVLGGLMVGLTLAGVAASGCGKAAEFCDLMCECELCNDRKHDECIIDTDAQVDTASAYECDVEFDAYLDCVMEKADCDDNSWHVDGDDCDNESEDYYECVSDATDLGGSSGSSTSSSGSDVCYCSCTCESGGTGSVCDNSGCCSGSCESQCQSDGLGSSTSSEELCGSGGQ